MKKFLIVVGCIFGGLILLGILLPDPKKGATTPVPPAAGPVAAAIAEADAAEAAAVAHEPELEILKQTDENGAYGVDGAHIIHVKVRNNTGDLMQFVSLKGVFYDKKNNIVGTGLGNGMNLAAGASKTIDVVASGIDNADHYEVEVENVL